MTEKNQTIERAIRIINSNAKSHGLYSMIIRALARLNFKGKMSDQALLSGIDKVTDTHAPKCENYFGQKGQ